MIIMNLKASSGHTYHLLSFFEDCMVMNKWSVSCLSAVSDLTQGGFDFP
jgi:hypothetical protein